MAHPSWLPEDSTIVAMSNVLLLVLLVGVALRKNWWQSRARRATRKLLASQRRSKGLQYALNITVNQYHSLRRRFGRGPRHGIGLTPPLVRLDPPVAKLIVPPPLDLAPAVGEDPSSWQDSGCHTVAHLSGKLPLDDTRTRPIPPLSSEILRGRTRPPK